MPGQAGRHTQGDGQVRESHEHFPQRQDEDEWNGGLNKELHKTDNVSGRSRPPPPTCDTPEQLWKGSTLDGVENRSPYSGGKVTLR